MVLLDSYGKIICADRWRKLGADPTGKGFPWAPPAGGRPPNNFRGSGSIRPAGEPPTFDLPMNVPTSKPSAGQKLPAKAGTRGEDEKERSVTWQMENWVHAWARNQTKARSGQPRPVNSGVAESTDVCRWVNRRPQRSGGPFGDAAPPPANTVAVDPQANKRKSEPTEKVAAARPPPKPNLPEMGRKGKPKSLMQPQQLAEIHPFTPTLQEWQHGIKADCGPDWSWEVIEAAVARGPHPTASTPEALEVFRRT
jgi:hypothetical protein